MDESCKNARRYAFITCS